MAVAAASAPALLAHNIPPSPTFWNQALAVALWSWFVAASAGRDRLAGAGPLFGALIVVLLAVAWSWDPGALPSSLALSAAGLLLAAMLLVAGGAATHGRADASITFGDFCLGWAVAGALNVAVALLQVFAPDWIDGDVVAHSGIPGRAVGNLRQPNHLSSLLLWSAIAVVALLELRRVGRKTAAALFAALVFAVVLTASRTGLVSVLLLAVWGVFDRRLSRPARVLLVAAPLVYALGWFGMAEWAKLSEHTFGGAARLAESDISGSRYGIWRNTLALIAQQPWTGVGFGEFNFAWSLTPFPGRPVAFFDHTHNLPLQLAVELGLPLAALVLGLLLWALAAAAWRAWTSTGDSGSSRRAAFMMVLMIGLHSLLEYPLWYAYFLLPAAWAFAYALGTARGAPAAARQRPAPAFVVAASVLVAGSVFAVVDYGRMATIFSAEEGAPPLAERIARGQHSVFFAHHADYAAATTDYGAGSLAPFTRATHYLLDTRLMVAWARALAANGQVDDARFVAARLREFRNPAAADFFAECDTAPAAFQCEPPQQADPGWRHFLSR